tara:strand:- start:19846 stop:20619 length:774 start_codon:yes stop_codon:yes gene_type:complete
MGVGADWRRAAKWTSAGSFVLLLVAIASFGPAMDQIEPLQDPEKENVAEVEAGESLSVDLIEGRYYVALRIIVEGEDTESLVRLIDSEGEEMEESLSSNWFGDRPIDGEGPLYRPVKIYFLYDSGSYVLHNDGDDTLWLVDESSMQLKMLTIPTVLLLFSTCCFGLISGVMAIILAILSLRFQRITEEKVTGIVVSDDIMSTDELYRTYHKLNDEEKIGAVADPFVNKNLEKEILEPEVKNEINPTSESEWKEWDEG